MNLKWGGQMNNKKCIYYVEGPCEQQLINALKEAPGKLIPGKVKVYNVIQNLIPKSQMLSIQPDTIVALVFDTDTAETSCLKKNIELLKKYCGKIKIVYMAQVLNFEDELARCTDVKAAQEITKSNGVKNFKSDFCKMKVKDCRSALDRHQLDVSGLWETKRPAPYDFTELNSCIVKK